MSIAWIICFSESVFVQVAHSAEPAVIVAVTVWFLLETCTSLRPDVLAPQPLPCMLLFQFSSHWAANNLKQQGYSLTALSGESPCLSPPDLSPAGEAVGACAHGRMRCMCACAYISDDYISLHVMERWNVCVRGEMIEGDLKVLPTSDRLHSSTTRPSPFQCIWNSWSESSF